MTVRRSSFHIRNLIDYGWRSSSHEISKIFQKSPSLSEPYVNSQELDTYFSSGEIYAAKSCLLHRRSSLLFKTQDHSLVPLPGDNNSDPLEVRTMKRISQVLKRHYIAYIHSCIADLCLIFL